MEKVKIIHLKRKNKAFSDFKKKEWEPLHPYHYGTEVDWQYWDVKKLRLKAVRGKEIVGALNRLNQHQKDIRKGFHLPFGFQSE